MRKASDVKRIKIRVVDLYFARDTALLGESREADVTRSSATAEKTAVGRCVYADAIHTASFARSRVYSHSR